MDSALAEQRALMRLCGYLVMFNEAVRSYYIEHNSGSTPDKFTKVKSFWRLYDTEEEAILGWLKDFENGHYS